MVIVSTGPAVASEGEPADPEATAPEPLTENEETKPEPEAEAESDVPEANTGEK
jgi:hypothetical protein